MNSTTNSKATMQGTNIASKISTAYIVVFITILPLKFGSLIDNSGVGFFPLSIDEWIFSNWPSFLVPAFASVALLLANLSNNKIGRNSFFSYKHLWLPSLLLLFSSLIGCVLTTEIDYALLFVYHMLGLLIFVIAIIIHTLNYPHTKKFFLASVMGGSLLSVYSGLEQVQSGFSETKNYAVNIAKQRNQTLSRDLINRLNQTRAFAAFTYPNSYAAHLILTMPIVIAGIFLWSSKIHPPRISQILFTTAALAPCYMALTFTGSRGALIALLFTTVFISLLAFPAIRKIFSTRPQLTFSVITTFVVLSAIATIIVFRGRTVNSVTARITYYVTATQLFIQHPLVGVGLGEFFTNYIRLKPVGAEETRLVHNAFLHFLSQCGLIGGIAIGYFILQPIIIWRSILKGKINTTSPIIGYATLIGCMAWNIHSLTDFNIQIPATVMTAGVLPILVVRPLSYNRPATDNRFHSKYFTLNCIILAIVGLSCLWRTPGERLYQKLYNSTQYPDAAILFSDHQVAARLPFSPYPCAIKGHSAYANQNYEEAERSYKEALKRTPHRAAYYANLARSQIQIGKLSEAHTNISKALYWYPTHPDFKNLSDFIEQVLNRNAQGYN